MRKSLLATTILAAMVAAGAAQAADLATKMPVKAAPVAPAFSWTGFYIGAQGGYGWAKNDFSNSYDPQNPSTLVTYGPADAHYNLDGGLVGGVIGYNYQINNIVLGVEADANWADLTGSGSYSQIALDGSIAKTCIQSNDACTSKIDALGTITGRLGYAFDRVLVYAKGGAAWATTSHTAGFTDLSGDNLGYHASTDATRWGWTVGAGVEWAFFNNWSAKVEYNYIDLGSNDVTFNFVPNTYMPAYTSTVDQSVQLVKAGINYRF
ncbi:outer membrane protein [Xanthobacter oligotrophicus]|uniref:outer membrane protein n=1 Tax=Xanthobacter oligotrophicus TaxID=2607286 RepID=UPI0011F0CEC6|nr:outer membrane protein [Xanthobacter oligotrophicus]MCG5234839.1 porin family protein [Xanthobacter oligotrophicus]